MLRKILIMLGLAVPLATGTQMAGAQDMTGEKYQVSMPSGLQYTDVKVGTGATAVAGKSVTVHYTGTLTNGTKFDSSKDRGKPFTFQLGAGMVIKGWDDGVAGMKVGGERKLYIPSDLAYGAASPSPKIPSNSTLLFDVELLNVE